MLQRNELLTISPAEMLKKRVLQDMDITQEKLAEALGVSRFTVNQILNGKRGISAEMALRLSRVLGTSAEMWQNLQCRVDLEAAKRKLAEELSQLPQLRSPKSSDELRARSAGTVS